ncbi:Photosystem I chlorophyll a apoprotein A2 [compost metagenome]
MKIKNFFYSSVLLMMAIQAFGQKEVATGDKKYDNYSYIDAIATYERVAEKGYKDEKMFQKLGNAFYFNAELIKAEKWYTELFAMNYEQEPEYFYRYSQSLKAVGNYTKANEMLEEFNKRLGHDQRGQLYVAQRNYQEEIKANSGRYEIADAGVNSEYSDYGSALINGNLVFASARDTGGVSKKVFKWTNKSFTNLYSAAIMPAGEMGKPERFSKKINSKFNESSPVFTQDGQTMYFTRNNFLEGKRGNDAKKITLLKLYKATLEEGNWVNVTELPFNSDEYSIAHPALSADGQRLYFASDMPGTLGQSDLFFVQINSDGTFSAPQNLGKAINTEGRETFPFVSADNELYFASDGRPGLGGLDVFVSKINDDGSYGDVQNVGAPINGGQDDFAMMIDSKNKNGYFTSNRDGGHGYDDIYRFTEIRKLNCEQTLAGDINDSETLTFLGGTKVTLLDSQFKIIKETVADANGKYAFEVDCGKTYYVRAEKESYETKEAKATIARATGKTELALQLTKRIKPIDVGTDLAKTLDIPIIYFDLDKSVIRKDAAFELEKVLAVMQQYPEMKIDVRSHTDSRQTKEYNAKLSDKRAKATIAWLITNGIDTKRLTGKGYGETQLVNHCADGVKCTGAEHQANRRSEFIIVSMK